VWDENSASNADVTVIPSQLKVTKQILLHWQPFRDLKLKYVGSRQAEQLSLRSQQRVVATVEESVLKTEMAGLESQEEDAPKRLLFFKTMSWLGQIRPHRRDESWSASLCQTFFSTSMGAQIPAHDWMVDQLADLFRTTHKVKTSRWLKAEVIIVETSSWRDI
jgi:hypothetical protein